MITASMDVVCPHCNAGYQVDESRIPTVGLRMRCPKCGGSVRIEQSGKVTAVAGGSPTVQGMGAPPRPLTAPLPAPPAISLQPKAAVGELDFGDLDLPEPVDSADLPAPAGGVDLPALKPPTPASTAPKFAPPAPSPSIAAPPKPASPKPAPPKPAAPKPAPPKPAPILGELDIPTIDDADLPMPMGRPRTTSGVDLPGPLSAVEIPTPERAQAQALDFQDLDLPEPIDELPAPADSLPAPAAASLPAPAAVPYPAPVGADLVAPSTSTDLPVRKGGEDLPAPGGLEFGEVDLAESDVAPIESSRDSMEFDGFPVESGGTDLPLPRAMSPGGSEVDLVAPRGMVTAEASGGSIELAIDPGRTSRVPVAQAPTARARKRRSRKFWQGALLVLLLGIAGGGAALAWTPYGLFASNVIAPLLPQQSSDGVPTGYLRAFRLGLKMDTYRDYQGTLSEIAAARKSAPHDVPLRAYATYARYMTSLRFGANASNDREASRLAESLDFEAAERPEVVLAAAAREAFRNQLPRAESRVARMTSDPDALALAGWIALLRGSLDAAETRFTRLAQIEPGSARAAYGMLKVKVARRDFAAAKAQAAAVLGISSHHVGARLALARILWQEERQEVPATAEIQAALGAHVRFAAPAEQAEAHALLGSIQLARSRFGGAKASFEAALAADPHRVEALVGLGQILLRAGEFAEAQTRFDAARRIAPDDLEATIGAAGALVGLDRLVEAKELLTGLGAERVATAEVQFWIGRTEETLDNAAAAETAYRAAIEKKPELVEASVRLAAMFERAGKATDARQVLETARAHAPDTADAHAALGEGFAARGQLDVAEVELRRALQIDGENLPAEFQLGVILRRSGRFEEAKGQLDQVAARDPAFPGLSLERGRLYEQTGEAERALAMYQDLLRESPDDVDLQLRVGATSFVAGKLEDAERVLRQVALARPTSAEAQHYLGRTLLSMEQASEAAQYLRRAVDLDGEQADHHLYYGWALDLTGALPQALAALDEAVRIDAESPRAWWRRGVVKLRLGDAPEARRDLEKAIELSPDLADAHAALAETLDRMRELRGAMQEYRAALERNEAQPEWQYRYGILLLDAGRERDAKTALERSVTLLEPTTPKPFWFADLLRNLGTARRVTGDRRGAAETLRRYLEVAPPDAPDRRDVERELEDLG